MPNTGLRHLVLGPGYLTTTSAAELAPKLQDNDLIPGVYEGGFKLWNCAVDVLTYCRDHGAIAPGARVLDAGCGHGLLGIHALQAGAAFVCFQDYNPEVLAELTIPNVWLNCGGDSGGTNPAGPETPPRLQSRTAFWAGDWAAFPPPEEAAAAEWQFDVVVCSDVLYTAQTTAKVFALAKACLRPGGAAYIGSKAFYFGCGGGVLELEAVVGRDPAARLERVALAGGASDLRREVVLLTFPPPL